MVIILLEITVLQGSVSFPQYLIWPKGLQAFCFSPFACGFEGFELWSPNGLYPEKTLEHRAGYCNLCSEGAGLSPTWGWAGRSSWHGTLGMGLHHGGISRARSGLGSSNPTDSNGLRQESGHTGLGQIDSIGKRKGDKQWTCLRCQIVHANDCTNSPVLVTANPAFGENQAGTSAWTTEASGLPK